MTNQTQSSYNLSLTKKQYYVLCDIVQDTVDYLISDLITIEDDNGNEKLEDISEYEVYKILQQLKSLKQLNPSTI
mgnify:CR=1 FL=1